MGEVYRATDTKLDREVAIKVMSKSFAEDRERLARFEREAKVLASLNHPHIAAIHGIEETPGGKALILELVEGETLADRLRKNALSVGDALETCRQIAEALEIANAKGVIHRDLKPGNVKITNEGIIKVLDFGLAKAEISDSSVTSNAQSNDSPTLTADFTQPGTILGTAAYMSPEQARGKPVDKRTDIWSFGCLLFECLTGSKAFPGEDITDTLASVIKGEPAWSKLPPSTPPGIQLLLRKCLAKDRKRRLQDMGDARVDLEHGLADPSSSLIRLSDKTLQGSEKHPLKGRLRLCIVAVLGILLGGIAMKWTNPATKKSVRRYSINLGIDGEIYANRGASIRISPDGSTIAFMGTLRSEPNSARKLFLRRLDELEAQAVQGSEGLHGFAFSPDSRWLAIKNRSTLSKILISGGKPEPVGEPGIFNNSRGTHWSQMGTITIGSRLSGLQSIQINEGLSTALTSPDKEGQFHKEPQLLPGGKGVLFHIENDNNENWVVVQPLPKGEPLVIARNAHTAQYAHSGHILYVRDAGLYAVPFNPNTLKTEPSPAHILDGITSSSSLAHYHISEDGTLVYVPGAENEVSNNQYTFEWIDRKGESEDLLLNPANYKWFRLSPDGSKIAYHSEDESGLHDIWVHEIGRTGMRITLNPEDDVWPIWSPSGKSIAFTSYRDSVSSIYWTSLGNPQAKKIYAADRPLSTWWWHPDGKHIAVSYKEEGSGRHDIMAIRMDGDDQTGFQGIEMFEIASRPELMEWTPSFSPDGQWVAYASEETGTMQIYVQSFPEGNGRKRISEIDTQSDYPVWSQDGKELLFASGLANGQHQIYTTTYQVVDGAFNNDSPVPWNGATTDSGNGNQSFAIAPNGERLLVKKRLNQEEIPPRDNLILVENFFEMLNKMAPSNL